MASIYDDYQAALKVILAETASHTERVPVQVEQNASQSIVKYNSHNIHLLKYYGTFTFHILQM